MAVRRSLTLAPVKFACVICLSIALVPPGRAEGLECCEAGQYDPEQFKAFSLQQVALRARPTNNHTCPTGYHCVSCAMTYYSSAFSNSSLDDLKSTGYILPVAECANYGFSCPLWQEISDRLGKKYLPDIPGLARFQPMETSFV
ncbi:hypothetical protein CYMTET_47638 [Cymbomonas tetramitiformis]|uniref:Uncharacterized protein n=1 Tax=Cymbomonas tetramitiformis TaxID=36881 RepID=A0AAE0EXI6_9CHLO|nr:hypothetical protein CYMTET_47638 [Cymbomonas tetramitiformis]